MDLNSFAPASRSPDTRGVPRQNLLPSGCHQQNETASRLPAPVLKISVRHGHSHKSCMFDEGDCAAAT